MTTLIKQQLSLINQARAQYGQISFCGRAQTWHECFTFEFGEIHFWFNDSDGDTHVISEVCDENTK